MGRFEEEREIWQRDIATLAERMKVLQLEHDETIAQLEQLKEASLGHKREVSSRLRIQIASPKAVLAIS